MSPTWLMGGGVGGHATPGSRACVRSTPSLTAAVGSIIVRKRVSFISVVGAPNPADSVHISNSSDKNGLVLTLAPVPALPLNVTIRRSYPGRAPSDTFHSSPVRTVVGSTLHLLYGSLVGNKRELSKNWLRKNRWGVRPVSTTWVALYLTFRWETTSPTRTAQHKTTNTRPTSAYKAYITHGATLLRGKCVGW